MEIGNLFTIPNDKTIYQITDHDGISWIMDYHGKTFNREDVTIITSHKGLYTLLNNGYKFKGNQVEFLGEILTKLK